MVYRVLKIIQRSKYVSCMQVIICKKCVVFQALLKDALNVKITALKCLYDLVLKYSFAKLGGI